MSIPTEKVGYATGIRKDVRDGLRLVVRTTWIRVTMLLSAVANLVCIAPLYVLLPSVIEKSGGDGRLLGVVTAIQATATAVFALVAGKYGHRVSRGVTVYALVITTGLGVCMLGGGISRVWLIVASMVVMGLGFAFNVVENALIQELIPQNFLARVYSVNSVTSFALAPLGYVISGVLARVIGDGPVLIGGGAILACSALLSALVTRWSLAGELVLPGEVRISRPIA
jgi:DHA3 family tetracycline resistance protein-like MFS transporter